MGKVWTLVWCSLVVTHNPHSKIEALTSLYFCFSALPKNRAGEGNRTIFLTPVTPWHPLLGEYRPLLTSGLASPLLRCSSNISLTRMTRRWSAFTMTKNRRSDSDLSATPAVSCIVSVALLLLLQSMQGQASHRWNSALPFSVIFSYICCTSRIRRIDASLSRAWPGVKSLNRILLIP